MTASNITAWSISRLHLYETCPAQFKYQNIDKLPSPPHPAMARGDAIHKKADKYVNGAVRELPSELSKFKRLFGELRAVENKITEQKWAFTSTWRKTGYFDKNTWLRVILDAGVQYDDNTVDVIDYKTGKKYGSNIDQMKLFAGSAFSYWPQTVHVTTKLWYLDLGTEDVEEFTPKDLPAIKADFEKRAAKLMQEQQWPARPNEKCFLCNYRKSNSGPCRFG